MVVHFDARYASRKVKQQWLTYCEYTGGDIANIFMQNVEKKQDAGEILPSFSGLRCMMVEAIDHVYRLSTRFNVMPIPLRDLQGIIDSTRKNGQKQMAGIF